MFYIANFKYIADNKVLIVVEICYGIYHSGGLRWRHMGESWRCHLSLQNRSTCKNDQ